MCADPTLIAPLFNKFDPLPKGQLRCALPLLSAAYQDQDSEIEGWSWFSSSSDTTAPFACCSNSRCTDCPELPADQGAMPRPHGDGPSCFISAMPSEAKHLLHLYISTSRKQSKFLTAKILSCPGPLQGSDRGAGRLPQVPSEKAVRHRWLQAIRPQQCLHVSHWFQGFLSSRLSAHHPACLL